MIPAGLDPDGKLNLDSINADLDYYVTQGYLPEKPNITQFADLSIVEEALLGLKKQ
jgi:hypothetical protein